MEQAPLWLFAELTSSSWKFRQPRSVGHFVPRQVAGTSWDQVGRCAHGGFPSELFCPPEGVIETLDLRAALVGWSHSY